MKPGESHPNQNYHVLLVRMLSALSKSSHLHSFTPKERSVAVWSSWGLAGELRACCWLRPPQSAEPRWSLEHPTLRGKNTKQWNPGPMLHRIIESQQHGMAWVENDLWAHVVSSPHRAAFSLALNSLQPPLQSLTATTSRAMHIVVCITTHTFNVLLPLKGHCQLLKTGCHFYNHCCYVLAVLCTRHQCAAQHQRWHCLGPYFVFMRLDNWLCSSWEWVRAHQDNCSSFKGLCRKKSHVLICSAKQGFQHWELQISQTIFQRDKRTDQLWRHLWKGCYSRSPSSYSALQHFVFSLFFWRSKKLSYFPFGSSSY